jgi:hypothetical protein
MADIERIGPELFRLGERLAAEAEAERDRVRRLREELEVEVERARMLTARLEARLASEVAIPPRRSPAEAA